MRKGTLRKRHAEREMTHQMEDNRNSLEEHLTGPAVHFKPDGTQLEWCRSVVVILTHRFFENLYFSPVN